ncbi:cytochrome aa3 quinol oxidase subunit IV [Bacillus sp. 03113]|uniref:cytochrome aa3 quinol oxidase subunit IV n=1 Tax=Bacillus sp. 03113 TaxID=2578211 RepID=UPI00114155DA|nr:cytochrome aa3 quinol oxidase subunit IV [Bacillus sp. 03113]
MANNNHKSPISHIVGFLLSLILTFGAIVVALKTSLPKTAIIWIIGTLAVIQAGLQLFMFMHMNEGKDGKVQTINIIYAFICAFIIVAGSIWVMASGHSHYNMKM